MTKQQLQQELLAKVKLGTKPSQLRKSKSLSDLPKNIQPTEPLRRKSLEPLTNLNSLQKNLEQAQDEISILALKVETQKRELTEFKAENSHLKEQAEIKQKELEDLRKVLEIKSTELSQTKQELDNSLIARYQGLKDWGQEHQKNQALNNELDTTIEQSAEEINQNDETIISLRSQLFKANQQINNLQKDLNLTQRLVELRSEKPYLEPEFNGLNYFKYAVYALLTVWFCWLLKRRNYV